MSQSDEEVISSQDDQTTKNFHSYTAEFYAALQRYEERNKLLEEDAFLLSRNSVTIGAKIYMMWTHWKKEKPHDTVGFGFREYLEKLVRLFYDLNKGKKWTKRDRRMEMIMNCYSAHQVFL
jgi:hypothetical protein